MFKTAPPWLARQAIFGFLLGAIAGLAVFVIAPAGPVFQIVLVPALIIAGYLAGFAAAARARLDSATRYILRLREELRGSQDHIMAHGSSRALAAYMDHVAGTLKAPLAALDADSRALASDPSLPETARAAAARLASQAALVTGALGPLAAFSLPDRARAPFNVNDLVREALQLCRHRAQEKKIRIEERYGVVPPVFGPAGRVQGAVLNVIVNAIEAMPHTGGTLFLETSHEGDRVIGRFRDSGLGIRPEHLGKVFNPFFTTKPERTSAGLGLWETHETLESIGATIELRSAPHQGTEVVMSFPQAAPMSPGRAGERPLEELSRNTADEGDRRIA
jgi:signal transduction histidine kinase